MASRPLNVLSICSGGGGLDLGVMLAEPGARVVAFVEREAFAAAVLVARMEDASLCAAPLWDDVASFDGEPWRGVVDCLTAGFPCQPWSVAGRRRGMADERWLWPEIVRIVREVGPAVVFLENVPGLVGEGLGRILGDLASLGFDAEWGVLAANEVGAPHRRRRVFILAYANLERWWPESDGRRGEGDDLRRGENAREPGVGGRVLADAGRLGVARLEPQSLAGRGGEAAARGAGARLADADRARKRQREWRWPQWRWPGDTWPPGPGDVDRWRAVLARAPELAPATQPAVCGVADGLAAQLVESVRSQRLALLGNGVVPLEAALAWRVLLTRALAHLDRAQ